MALVSLVLLDRKVAMSDERYHFRGAALRCRRPHQEQTSDAPSEYYRS
jgi:hypothetical protein